MTMSKTDSPSKYSSHQSLNCSASTPTTPTSAPSTADDGDEEVTGDPMFCLHHSATPVHCEGPSSPRS
ncbi:hypothetical protein VKT23_010175 [Stygiomarasmius scandens]|uniref:Uncharacterized protein n=1 Tax=Marasmiellus scandens TaxID=2682957 RepID=A0ABR1JC87_9AGAR